ncbi:hypothetical protein DSO57_1033264 [Entomophthora muscae]|uniref:Uncharacterized protein n=1 Tax=Entomophthora muscae TaxID=34485 RepID=A0ACC2SP34_9FUNG|nr:hypothetical protein DSO57_1033264 [Entomophthora muscae]
MNTINATSLWEPISPKMIPLMAVVNINQYHECPAIIFNSQYAITAAECIVQYSSTSVQTGFQTREIIKVEKAPKYVRLRKWDHNAAIITLDNIPSKSCLTLNKKSALLSKQLYVYSFDHVKRNHPSKSMSQRKYIKISHQRCQGIASIHMQHDTLYNIICVTPKEKGLSKKPAVGSPLVSFRKDSECPEFIGPVISVLVFDGEEVVIATKFHTLVKVLPGQDLEFIQVHQ